MLGVVREKELDKLLAMMPKSARYYYCRPDVPRGLKADELAKAGSERGLSGKVYQSVRKALAAARVAAENNDLIYIGGSTFVVAEVV